MYEPFSDDKAIKMIKEDELGDLALTGMELLMSTTYNLPKCSVGVEQAVSYLRDTYLECINSQGFFEWIMKGNDDGKPLILSKYHFKEIFKEIDDINASLQGMIDDIAILYNQEWWIFGYEDYDIFLATTSYKDDYSKLNLIEVHKAMSVFITLFENWDEVTSEERENFIKEINKATNNMLNNYKINEMSNFELIELVNDKLGLGYL